MAIPPVTGWRRGRGGVPRHSTTGPTTGPTTDPTTVRQLPAAYQRPPEPAVDRTHGRPRVASRPSPVFACGNGCNSPPICRLTGMGDFMTVSKTSVPANGEWKLLQLTRLASNRATAAWVQQSRQRTTCASETCAEPFSSRLCQEPPSGVTSVSAPHHHATCLFLCASPNTCKSHQRGS
jgi:hypothetical protein